MQQRKFFITGKVILGFLLMAGIFACGIWLVFRSLRQLSGDVAVINEPNQKLATWKSLRAEANEAADLIRKYALSEDDAELERFEELRIDLPLRIDSLRQRMPLNLRHFTDSLELLTEAQFDILSLLSSAPAPEQDGEVLEEAVSTLGKLQRESAIKAETTYTHVKIKQPLPVVVDTAGAKEKRRKRRRVDAPSAPTVDTATITQTITSINYKPDTNRDAELLNSVDRLRRREKFAEQIRNEGRLELLINNQALEQRLAVVSDRFETDQLRQSAKLIATATAAAEQRALRIAEWLAGAGLVLILFFTLLIHRDSRRAARLRRQTERARDNAEKLAQAKEEFVANMSHEVRTPLNVINGFSSLLLRAELPDEQQKQAQAIQRSSQYLLALINDTLDYAKMTAGKFELDKYPFDTRELFSDVSSAFEADAQTRGIQLLTNIAPNVPAQLHGDPMRLRQVLFNLVSNAMKFTADGSVEIGCSAEPSDEQQVKLIITITDTGIGIPKEKLSTIFEAFSQADSSITRRFGGTGLGLTISRLLIERMNGQLTVSSQSGKGSVFTVTLSDMQLAVPQVTAPTTITSYEALQGLQVLVCDDEELNRIVAQQLLEHYGIVVREADGGDEALKQLELAPVDVVLMDLQMPGRSGLDTLLAIRNTPAIAQTVVIAVTGNSLPEERQRCLEAGMNAYLVKPYTEQQLLDLLLDLSGRKTP